MGCRAVPALILAVMLAGPALGAEGAETTQAGSRAAQQPASPPASSRASEADEAQLKERVLARWQALIKGDFDVAYQFETPAYRAIYTLSQFRYQFGNQIFWRMANVMDIHYDNTIVARVHVEVAYRYAEPEKRLEALSDTQGISEIWLKKEGQWWHNQ